MAKRGAVANQGKTGGSRSAGRRGPHPSLSATAGLPMLRNSERSTLKRCEFLWDLTYNRKVKPITDMPALRFGSLVHAALACYYIPGVKRGESPVTAFERLYAEDLAVNEEIFGMRVGDDEVWVNAQELGIAMMTNYLDEYGKDDEWEVLVTEYPFQTMVLHPQTGEPWFYYVGVVDGVWRNRRTKEVWIPDHKTAQGIGDKNWRHLVLDDQAGGYWSFGVDAIKAAGLMRKNQHLHGMLYNIMRKAMPDERASKIVDGRRVYLNLDGSVSKKQPSPYFLRRPIFRDEFDMDMARHRAAIDFNRADLFRDRKLDITKSPGQFTCPMCPMRDACELHETGGDWESFLDQTTKSWDPYDAHEIYDGR